MSELEGIWLVKETKVEMPVIVDNVAEQALIVLLLDEKVSDVTEEVAEVIEVGVLEGLLELLGSGVGLPSFPIVTVGKLEIGGGTGGG